MNKTTFKNDSGKHQVFSTLVCKALGNSASAIVRMNDGSFGVGRIWAVLGGSVIENPARFNNITDANAEAIKRESAFAASVNRNGN